MRFLQADAIFDGQIFLEEGSILAINTNDEVDGILSKNSIEDSRIERFQGILTPGFINSHCHLELSHLKGKVPEQLGLPKFGKQIITQRNQLSEEEQLEHIKEADRFMFEKGIVAVGDICNSSLSFKQKAESKLYYHNFIELIGLQEQMANKVMQDGLSVIQIAKHFNLISSLSPHAPYSVSKTLFTQIKNYCEERQWPLTIHNQESEEELKFLDGKPNEFDELFSFLKIDLRLYEAPKKNGLEYLRPYLIPEKSILVHNTYSSERDIEISKSINNFWCFCPRANLYIEQKLPNFSIFDEVKEQICIGTDSLASNWDLDILKEANLLLESNCFSLTYVLRSLTSSGAKALGVSDRFGKIAVTRKAEFNLIQHQTNQLHYQKKIM